LKNRNPEKFSTPKAFRHKMPGVVLSASGKDATKIPTPGMANSHRRNSSAKNYFVNLRLPARIFGKPGRERSMKKSARDPKQILFSCVLIASLLICAGVTLAAQKKGATPAAASVFAQDKGKFVIQLKGQTVGHEDFDIAPSGGGWTARGTTDLKPPDSAATRTSGTLALQPDGAPISYEWTSQAEKKNGAHILFANGVAKITLEMQGARPFEQDMTFNTPLIAVLDNNLYYQYAVLARIYDWSKSGAQNLPVLIPQELTPGSVVVEATGSLIAGGKSYDGLRVTTSDLQILLYLDTNHRLMRLEVPAASVSVVRE
jgi:hypothetical protein